MPLRARGPHTDDPVDAALRAPHSATLVAWSLAFVSALSTLAAISLIRAAPHPEAHVTPGAALVLVLAAIAGTAAVTLLAAPSTRRTGSALVGLLVLDLAPPLLQVTATEPDNTRGRVALLILPTMIAAASITGRFFRGQLLLAVGIATIMLAASPGERSAGEVTIEVALTVGVLVAGSIMVRRVSAATTQNIAALRTLALTDKLTGVANRRGLAGGFEVLVAAAARGGGHIGVISLDIDHFKWFNDTYGHAAGDEVLRLVCRELREAAGDGGLVARTGGEELVALVPGPAEPVAVALRARLAGLNEPRVTVSIGVLDVDGMRADARTHAQDFLWRLLGAADAAMYRAKTTGRDRICRAEFDPETRVTPPLAPIPAHAAVPNPDAGRASTTGTEPGWVLGSFALAGIVSGFVRHTATSESFSVVGQLYMTIMTVALLGGVVIIGMGPLMDRFRWTTGVVGTDLVILVWSADLTSGASRMVAVLPTLITGLMVAQHFSRRLLLAHHVVTVGICMTATTPTPSVATVGYSLFTAAVIIGSTELIRLLQQRSIAAADDLHRWSVTDPLTGLANRHGLELGFEALSRAQQLTVLALDVDDFKGINDTYGHAAGDDALVRLAATLRAVTSPDTVVCRTGGDEFVVLAPSMRPSALTSVVKRAAALLPLPLSVSVGSAVAAPHRLRSLWQLVDAADSALMRAKRSRTKQRRAERVGLEFTGPESLEVLGDGDHHTLRDTEGDAEHGAEDAPRPGRGQDAMAAGAAGPRDPLIDNEDGSSADTSTVTVSPSTSEPARRARAS